MMQLNVCIHFNHEFITKMNDTRVLTCELDIYSLDSNDTTRNALQPYISPMQLSCVIGKLSYVTRKLAKSIIRMDSLHISFTDTSLGLIRW